MGVARLWAPLAGTLVVDEQDAELADNIEAQGMRCIVAPSVMSGPKEAANLARAVLGTQCSAASARAKPRTPESKWTSPATSPQPMISLVPVEGIPEV